MKEVANHRYIVSDRKHECVALVNTYKDFLAENLEYLLIGSTASVKWPSEIKAKIADTIVHGSLKYLNVDGKCCCVLHLETLSTGPCPDWKPLPFDVDVEGEAQKEPRL